MHLPLYDKKILEVMGVVFNMQSTTIFEHVILKGVYTSYIEKSSG